MNPTVLERIQQLRELTMPDLDRECRVLMGRPSWMPDRDQLFRRLAWHVQASSEGGLSQQAKARAAELAPAADLRLKGLAAAPPANGDSCRKDDRLPSPGTVLVREWRGVRIVVRVLSDGFEYEGRPFRSLSAIARQATGTSWNGYQFFGLAPRQGRAR